MNEMTGFEKIDLGNGLWLWAGRVPRALMPDRSQFVALWELHPSDYHEIRIHGRRVKTPRWQQAFGEDYHYTGRINKAIPIPALLAPFLTYARESIDEQLNGLLVNWYDGSLGHYIGRHRDSTKNMIVGTPIVTISLGQERVFRLRPWPACAPHQKIDLPATDGTVFLMPYATNQRFTHEVPHSTRTTGKRISLTFRAFNPTPNWAVGGLCGEYRS